MQQLRVDLLAAALGDIGRGQLLDRVAQFGDQLGGPEVGLDHRVRRGDEGGRDLQLPDEEADRDDLRDQQRRGHGHRQQKLVANAHDRSRADLSRGSPSA